MSPSKHIPSRCSRTRLMTLFALIFLQWTSEANAVIVDNILDQLPEMQAPSRACELQFGHDSDPTDRDGRHFVVSGVCSGLLLNNRVVTAFHCFDLNGDEKVLVKCDHENFKSFASKLPDHLVYTPDVVIGQDENKDVESAIRQSSEYGPTYGRIIVNNPQIEAISLGKNDLAVLSLDQSPEQSSSANSFNKNSIRLPSSPAEVDQLLSAKRACRIFGFGLNNEAKVGILTGAIIDIVNYPDLLSFYHSVIYQHDFAIGPSRGSTGDSGAPVICMTEQNQQVYVGLISGGFAESASTSVGSSSVARLSFAEKISYNLSWLRSQLQ